MEVGESFNCVVSSLEQVLITTQMLVQFTLSSAVGFSNNILLNTWQATLTCDSSFQFCILITWHPELSDLNPLDSENEKNCFI